MTSQDNFKVFWDAVHGQINIPNRLCKNILDTEYFQRLKRLEQTNTRPLYPSAHHDRFIHSLGTYHLGCLVFNAIKNNSADDIKIFAHTKDKENAINWVSLEYEFTLACLLHDVGHAPFSHTFEEFYNVDIEKEERNLLNKLLTNKGSINHIKNLGDHKSYFQSFKRDYDIAVNQGGFVKTKNSKGRQIEIKMGSDPKEHEKVSAFLVLTKFQQTIRESFRANPFNIARMILGIKFTEGIKSKQAIEKQILNCFIELLNGEEIDVDKIDYLIRDQWATGNIIRHIDCHRLLNSVYIKEDIDTGLLVNCFHKKAINEIIALKETKNSLVSNIHGHPIVKYDDYILKKAVNQTIKLELLKSGFCPSNENGSSTFSAEEYENNYVSKIVSVEALLKSISFSNGSVFLPSDDDLIHFLKKHLHDSQYAKEWQSRDYRLKALWKTPFDFNYHFAHLSHFEKTMLFSEIDKFTQEYVETTDWIRDKSLSKPYYIERNVTATNHFEIAGNINILIKGSLYKLSELINGEKRKEEILTKSTRSYFIVYLPSPFIAKQKDQKREQDRNGYVEFIITRLKAYIQEMNEKILYALSVTTYSSPQSISKDIFGYDDTDFEFKRKSTDIVTLFLQNLLANQRVICPDITLNPKKRQYSILDNLAV